MSEQRELRISELRRKKSADTDHPPHRTSAGSDGEPRKRNGDGQDEEDETWARPVTEESRFSRHQEQREYRRRLTFEENSLEPEDDEAIRLPFDPFRVLDAIKRNLGWCILASIFFGTLGLSWLKFGAKSQVQVQLIHRESPALFKPAESGNTEGFHPQTYTDQALVSVAQSPEMVRRVVAKAGKPVTPTQLARSLAIFSDRENEMITLQFKGAFPPKEAADLVNLYANEVIQATREMQTRDAKIIKGYLAEKLVSVNNELAGLAEEMKKLPSETFAADPNRQLETYLAQLADYETKYELLKIDLEANNPINDRLQLAREDLAELLLKYTDEHPFVQRQREKIKAIELQSEDLKANPGAGRTETDVRADNAHMVSSSTQKQSLAKQAEQLKLLIDRTRQKLNNLPGKDINEALLKNRYQTLEKIRDSLATRQREAELFEGNALGFLAVLAPATVDRVFTKGHIKKSLIFAIFGAFFGLFSVAGFVAVRECLDDRLKSPADIERATELPLLATLGDLSKLDPAQQRAWAFRTWTILKGKLSHSQNQGFVCGIISTHHGEGRSTWIKMLVNTANERGLRVLTISTKPSTEGQMHPHEMPLPEDHFNFAASAPDAPAETSQTLAPSVLASPAQVTKQLSDPQNGPPVAHIPLPGWVWNLERRKQWQNALSQWRRIENLVLLVELPPASEPESVLLAEKLPQLIWLTDSGKSTLKETRHHMETLRHAGCNLVGAVLNREPNSFFRNQLARWFGMIVVLLSLAGTVPAVAEEFPERLDPDYNDSDSIIIDESAGAETNSVVSTNRFFFVNNRTQKSPWQEKLTLGPGDMLNLGFFGDTNLSKFDVAIGPDGRISYLHATDVMATGLTIDELRAVLDKELAKYYRSPRSIVTPVSFKSKKYYVLGKVTAKGVFTLDKPITILEALAQAKGIETGMLRGNSIDLADLQRSFIIRDGKRLSVDFEKLFNEGDLSQNLSIAPDDYLYFPPVILHEIYVVGEVRAPGVLTHLKNTTLISAISERGGLTDRAYKSRVLVIRGSLKNPETFVVNFHDIVDAKMPDFKLEPKDIVYVSSRPFIKVEEILDLAVTGFIQSAITAWTGQYMGPFIKKPLLHGIYNN